MFYSCFDFATAPLFVCNNYKNTIMLIFSYLCIFDFKRVFFLIVEIPLFCGEI